MATPSNASSTPLKVLVTGSAGSIGRHVCAALRERGHFVRGLDLQPSPNADESIVADIAEPAAVQSTPAGMDAMIHLAAIPREVPFEELLRPNVIGLYSMMNAAHVNRVPRVVLASSVQAIGGIARGPAEPVPGTTTEPTSPRNHYALTKAWMEQMGQMYARFYGMSVICARIGWAMRNRDVVQRMVERGLTAHYVSMRDLGQFFWRAVETPNIDFAILFATGPGIDRPQWDLGPSRKVLGYEPKDRFPEGLTFPWP
jgi:nucleoside-diphosphate-sugar epimerase